MIDKWIELIDCVNSCKPFKQENVDDHVIRATIGKLRKKFFFKWIITPYHFEYINLEIIKCSKNMAKFILKKLGIYEYIRKKEHVV